jgi:hypothetical protein
VKSDGGALLRTNWRSTASAVQRTMVNCTGGSPIPPESPRLWSNVRVLLRMTIGGISPHATGDAPSVPSAPGASIRNCRTGV